MSLKPPWRQKNPIMEKACQAYHKNTAPAEAVEALDEIKVVSGGSTIEEEVVATGKQWEEKNVTTVLYKKKAFPLLVAFVFTDTGKGKVYKVKFAKTFWHRKVKVSWEEKGKTITFPMDSQGIKEWNF